MIEFIKAIPGPSFLAIYASYASLVILIVKLSANRDYTIQFETPEPTKYTPIDLAIMNKGIKGAIITCVFNLWRIGAVEISQKSNSIVLKRREADTSQCNKLERTIYNFIRQPKFYRHLYKKSSINTVANILQGNQDQLLKENLLPDNRVKQFYWRMLLMGLTLLIIPGGLKLYLGIVNEKPFGFLVLILIIAIVTLVLLVNPQRVRVSALGRRLLASAKQRFKWLRSSSNTADILQDENLPYGIAIFGIKPFVNSDIGDIFENPALLDKNSNSSTHLYGCGCAGCGGGCGGGCSGGCGGCGGD